MIKFPLWMGVVLLSLTVGGCARVPASNIKSNNKILSVRFTTRGALDINRQPQGLYYFVLINRTDNLGDPSPAPVVAPPWGNGFAAPSRAGGQGFVGFVYFARDVGSSTNVGVYSCQVGGQLVDPTTIQRVQGFTALGPPDRVQTPQAGDNTLSFQLDLGRLPNPTKQWLQINIIATDVLPASPDNVVKHWDALGDGTQSNLVTFIPLDTTTNQIVTNSQQVGGPQEVANDVHDRTSVATYDDPALDIVDWTVEIRDP